MIKATVAAIGMAALMAGNAAAAPLPKPAAFAMCVVCHKVDKNAPKALGPNLWGIGGRSSGTLAGFQYSPAMKNARIQWNRANLIAFINDPRAKIPGNRMAYAGQRTPTAAATIADYLLSLK